MPSNNYSISKANANEDPNNVSSDHHHHQLPPGISFALPPGVSAEEAMENARFYEGQLEGGEAEEEEEDGDSDAEDHQQGVNNHSGGAGSAGASSSTDFLAGGRDGNTTTEGLLQGAVSSSADNRCDLLWQGLLPKRCFTGFKFHESQTTAAARKMMKARGVGHFWDMLEGADSLLASAAAPALF